MSHGTVTTFIVLLVVVVSINIFRSFRRTKRMIKRGPDWTPTDGFDPNGGPNDAGRHHPGSSGHGHGHHGGGWGGGGGFGGGGHHGGGGGGDGGGGHHH